MANIVGFNQDVADKALAGKADAQRKNSYKANALHISFRKGASLENNPFADALKGVKV